MKDSKEWESMAESISKSADILAKSWRQIILVGAISATFFSVYAGYKERAKILPAIYTRLAKDTSAPALSDEWNRVAQINHPEFYKCDQSGCSEDTEKKEAISNILKETVSRSGAEIALFTIYGDGWRQIAAQEEAQGRDRVKEVYWVAPLDGGGFAEALLKHRIDECNVALISRLAEDNYLRRAAASLGIKRVKTCPIAKRQNYYELIGYLSLSFADEDVPPDNIIEDIMKQQTHKIERVMGYI